MKKFLSCLLCSLIIICSVPFRSFASDLTVLNNSTGLPSYGWDGKPLQDYTWQDVGIALKNNLDGLGLQSFSNTVKNVVPTLLNTVEKGFDNLISKANVNVSPTVKYYRNNSIGDTYNYKDYVYTSNVFNSGNTYDFRTMEYITNNNHYTYNPITNDYDVTNNVYYTNNYDYDTYYYDDDNYYYSVTNNYTNYTYVIVPKANPSDIVSYSFFYALPDGSNSFNLTKDDVLGQYFNYNYTLYSAESETDNLLGLWHFDGNLTPSYAIDGVSLTYNGITYGNGKFDSAIKLNGTQDIHLSLPSNNEYTLEFWFFNAIEDYSEIGAYGSWIHCLYHIVNGSPIELYFNGVKHTRTSYLSYFQLKGIEQFDYRYLSGGLYWWFYSLLNKFGTLNSTTLSSFRYADDNPWYLPTPSYNFNGSSSYTFSSGRNFNFNTSNGTLGSSWFNSYNPSLCRHYFPLFSLNDVKFGFTSLNNQGTTYGARQVATMTNSISVDESSVTPDFDLASSGPYTVRAILKRTFLNRVNEDISSIVPTSFIDMSSCFIDEMRLSDGWVYTSDYITVPNSPFSSGYIWTVPSGTFNNGDLAFQSFVSPVNVRVGGAKFTYPLNGFYYITLDGDVATRCEYFYNGAWYTVPFGVYFNGSWHNGDNYNFKSMSWGESVEDTDINITVNVENLPDYDGKKTFDFISNIPNVFGLLIAFIGSIGIVPAAVLGGFGVFVTILITLIGFKLLKR